MREMLEELRHNPDIVAVLVIALTLGTARPSGPGAGFWSDPAAEMKIHRALSYPSRSREVLDSRIPGARVSPAAKLPGLSENSSLV